MFMERAVLLGKRSQAEPGRSGPPPKVGVVVVKDGEMVGEAYRGAGGPGQHAEYCVLERLAHHDLTGAEVFTTLEPCARRNPPKVPCAERLIERGIGTVYIGAFDPDPAIHRRGWEVLAEAGVRLRDFPGDLREEIERDSAPFLNSFRIAEGDSGEVRFDWTQNSGKFLFKTSRGDFETRWTTCGSDSVYAVDNGSRVVVARGARRFEQIDDPGAFRFDDHAVRVKVGEIVIFRNTDEPAFLLAKVIDVKAGPDRKETHHEAVVEFELRGPEGS